MKSEQTYEHSDLTYRIIGCAQAVHRMLGPGFPESVYHRSLCLSLKSQKIPFESEKACEVLYMNSCVGEFRIDILVAETVVLELKALSSLNGDHLAQVLSYLKATGLKVGLLINFGCKSLEMKRLVM